MQTNINFDEAMLIPYIPTKELWAHDLGLVSYIRLKCTGSRLIPCAMCFCSFDGGPKSETGKSAFILFFFASSITRAILAFSFSLPLWSEIYHPWDSIRDFTEFLNILLKFNSGSLGSLRGFLGVPWGYFWGLDRLKFCILQQWGTDYISILNLF